MKMHSTAANRSRYAADKTLSIERMVFNSAFCETFRNALTQPKKCSIIQGSFFPPFSLENAAENGYTNASHRKGKDFMIHEITP